MNKEEFFSLLDKYLEGKCNSKEEKVIEAFCERLQDQNHWELNDREKKRIRILLQINQRLDKKKSSAFVLRALSFVKYVAALILLFSLVWLINHQLKEETKPSYITKTTSKGQRVSITLPDGSSVKLSAESSITFPEKFATKTREVSLVGEGFFEVTKNLEKPFLVNSDNIKTTVLGTSFNVRAFPSEDIAVTVVSGKVRVATTSTDLPSLAKSVELEPGEQAVYAHVSRQLNKGKVDADAVVQWKDGILKFEDVLLYKVAKELERWYNVKIIFENENLKSCKIKIEFDNDSLQEVLNTLNFIFEIQYQWKGENQVLLTGNGCT